MGRAVGLAEFHRLTQAVTALSVGALTAAIYLVLPGHRNLWAAGFLAVLAVTAIFLASRLDVRGQAGGERILVLVTKPECALCEEAEVRLRALAGSRGLEVRTVSIAHDARLRRQYAEWVPVILWQHEELDKGRIDWERLAARLDAVAANDTD